MMLKPTINRLVLCLSLLFISSLVIAQETTTTRSAETIGSAVEPIIINIDPATLVKPKKWQPGDPIKDVPLQISKGVNPPPREPRPVGLDPLASQQFLATEQNRGSGDPDFGNIIINVQGSPFTGSSPSDTVGDIGNNFYVQAVNAGGAGGSAITILDKTDGSLALTFILESLAAGSGTTCAVGAGDPIVNFDETADNGPGEAPGKWVITEFTAPGVNTLCVFVSVTSDPTTGNWFLYEFNSTTGGFPDYPKYGVWPDAYYLGANEGPQQYALDRVNMIQGLTARPLQAFGAPGLPGFGFQHIMPVDWDGDLEPPLGAPGLFMRHRDTEIHGPAGMPDEDIIEIWEFSVDFDDATNSTFTGPINVSVAEFDSEFCGGIFAGCLAQPGSATTLFPLFQPIMWRAQYRNFGGFQSIVTNLATDVTGTDVSGVRWFELRDIGTGYSTFQQGTISEPGSVNGTDGISRWMASAAQDEAGNIAVGYNAAGLGDTGAADDVFPGMRYNGRLAVDPLGTTPQGEVSIIEGLAPNNSSRYGDYSALTVDPVDGCTFWYTAQNNPAANYSTQIASFRFASCGDPGFSLSAENAQQQVCAPDDLADITINVGSIADFTNPVTLSLDSPPTGFSANFTVNPVIPGNSTIAQISVSGAALTGENLLTVQGTAAGATDRTTSIIAEVFNAAPGVTTLLLPADGSINVDLAPILEWTASSQGNEYLIEIATDSGFTNVIYNATDTETVHQVGIGLDALVTYFWRVTPNNTCGEGISSSTFSFTTRDIPPVLLVDDDDNGPDTQSFFANALTSLGIPFDVFDTNNTDNEPGSEILAYDAVIWFSGDEFGGAAGPGGDAETELANFLEMPNKCLFLSSQDYFFDRGLTGFMTTYLGISAAVSDTGNYASVTGEGSSFSGLGTYTLDYPASGLADFSDILTIGDGELSFDGDNDNDAASGNPAFNTVFLSFPFEAIDGADNREEVLQTFFDTNCQLGGLSEDFFSDGFESDLPPVR